MAISQDSQLKDLVDISVPFDVETVLFSEVILGRMYDLNLLLDELCKRTGQCRVQSTCEYLTIDPEQADRHYNSKKIDVAVLGENSCQLQQLENRLLQEVAMVYFILAESATVNQTADERIISQVRLEPKSEPNNHSRLLQMKCRIVWLTYELNRCQRRILEMVQNGPGSVQSIGHNIVVTTTPTNQDVPLFRPLPGDRKPCNIDLQMFTFVREFIFKKTDVDKFAIRFQLVGRLDEGQWEKLRSSPHQFFLDMVRYIGLSGQDFLDACFRYDKDGNRLAGSLPVCPCGVDMECFDNNNIRAHFGCQFYKFVEDKCPSVLYNGYYKSSDRRVMGSKETAYIVDVVKKRLPESPWKQMCLIS